METWIAWLLSSRRHDVLTKVLVFLVLFMLVRYIYHPWRHKRYYEEGFDQATVYVLQRDAQVYDSFYAEMYDLLHQSKQRLHKELELIGKTVSWEPHRSSVLDVGCGTGHAVGWLLQQGFVDVQGVDRSSAMVAVAHEQGLSEQQVRQGDVLDSLLYDRARFTHLLCLYLTVYSFEDKRRFFSNCYHWLKPYGQVVVHVVDPKRYKPMKTCLPMIVNKGKKEQEKEGKKEKEKEEEQKEEKEEPRRLLFKGFQYEWKFSREGFWNERFIDRSTGKVREQEQTLFLDDDIVAIAKGCGFVLQGQIVLDTDQSLVVLQRRQ